MTIDKLIGWLLAKKTKAAIVAAAQALTADKRPVRPQGSQKEFDRELKRHLKDLGNYLVKNQRREAMATALALVIADAEFTIAEIRRIGLFRASRYAYQGSLVGHIATAILQIRPLLTLHPDRFAYLESVQALTRLAPNVRKLHDDLADFLRLRKDEVIKTILVLVNNVFYFGWVHHPEIGSEEPQHYSAEDFSEAASLVLSMYREMFKLTAETCNIVDEKLIKTTDLPYYQLLVVAAKINKFREAEATIDNLPYQAVLSGTSVTVSSIDPDIEKSVRLGYIQSQFQLLKRLKMLEELDAPVSIKEFVNQGCRTGTLEQVVTIVDKPIKRLTLRLPTAPQIFGLFSTHQRFRDEIENLLVLDVDNFDNKETTPTYKISDRISSEDIFKMQRYFRFLSCIYQKRLEGFTDSDRLLLTYRSTVLIMPRDEIVNQLNLIFHDHEKTKELVDYLTLGENRTFVDLQYTPIIVIDDHVVIAPHLVAASNLVRNIVTANKLRTDLVAGTIDPMQKAVADALAEAGFKVEVEAKIRISGKEVETDIVAWRDDTLFLFECKNAYLPCNAHEMRNSFEHIEKAGHQLTLRNTTFQAIANQKALFKKLGWNVQPTTAIHTGIVIANRVFHGAKMSGHPVRHAHEFINVVLRGYIGIGDEQISFWKGPTFQTADLVSYLNGQTVIVDQMSSLEPVTQKYLFGPRSLEILTYVLRPEKLDEKIRASRTDVGGDALI